MPLEEQTTLQGLTLKELKESYDYDPVQGVLTNKKTGKQVGYYTEQGFLVAKRVGDKTVTLRAGMLAYFLYYKVLPDGYVKFLDEDVTNLKLSNLFVAGRGRKRSDQPKRKDRRVWEDTLERRISYNAFRELWSVKRGKKDAVYWAKSLEEAISIRNEWESDKTIQKRDFYQDKYK